jgi:ElaB/YqjD/DUF883 family membrane-anchored ribosome-binding protein
MADDYKQAATYPSEEQYERWQNRADDMGMRSMSEFVESMVEAGLKKFDAASVEPDETNQELRQQRNDLKAELDRARARIEDLEDAVYHGERQAIKNFVDADPGASYDEIIQHVIDTVPERVTTHLDDMEGEDLRVENGCYYPRDEIATSDGGS